MLYTVVMFHFIWCVLYTAWYRLFQQTSGTWISPRFHLPWFSSWKPWCHVYLIQWVNVAWVSLPPGLPSLKRKQMTTASSLRLYENVLCCVGTIQYLSVLLYLLFGPHWYVGNFICLNFIPLYLLRLYLCLSLSCLRFKGWRTALLLTL
jgi:hypothetical protein